MKRKAFTLIELLVVIAIIALLLSIIMPSLNTAKQLASGAVCMSNQKNLALSWVSYAEENDSRMVGGSNYQQGHPRPTPYRWVEYPLSDDSDPSSTVPQANYTLETRQNGIRAGRLFDYTGDVDLYHCPGDKTMVKNPEPQAVFRSYEITGLMNGEDFLNRQGGIYSPIKTYRQAITSPGGSPKKLKVAIKTTDIRSPGNKLVFVESDISRKPAPYNTSGAGGWMLFMSNQFTWWDAPALFHNDSSTFGFADGHAERQKWTDPDTKALLAEGTPDRDPKNNEDLMWLARGYVPIP